jgi:hypothetical protein
MLRANPPRLSQNDAGEKQMPKLTKKEGLFLSRLQDQSGRLAISGNKYDRLIKAGYVLPEHDSFSPNIIHYTLTETGRRVLAIHKKKTLGDSHSFRKNAPAAFSQRGAMGGKVMEWFSRKTSIGGTQIPNWVLVLGTIIGIWLIYQFIT